MSKVPRNAQFHKELRTNTPVVAHIDGGGAIWWIVLGDKVVRRGEVYNKCISTVIIASAGKIIKPGDEGMIANLELLLELDIIEILDRVAIVIARNVVQEPGYK